MKNRSTIQSVETVSSSSSARAVGGTTTNKLVPISFSEPAGSAQSRRSQLEQLKLVADQQHSTGTISRGERNSRGSLAEFGPALTMLAMVLLIITIPIVRVLLPLATLQFITERAASSASKATTYGAARRAAHDVVIELAQSPVAKFAGLRVECLQAVSLFVSEHVVSGTQTNVVGPNLPLATPACPDKCVYEYEVRAAYLFSPAFSLDRLPVLRQVPFVDAPAIYTARAVRAVEFPEGLTLN
jgi:hypothetical protein